MRKRDTRVLAMCALSTVKFKEPSFESTSIDSLLSVGVKPDQDSVEAIETVQEAQLEDSTCIATSIGKRLCSIAFKYTVISGSF